METNKIYTLEFSYPQNPQKNGKHRIEVTHDEHKHTPMRAEIHSDWLEDDTWQFGGKTELGDWEEKMKTVLEKHGSNEIRTQYSKQGKEWVAHKKQELTKNNNIIIAQKDYVYKGGEWILEYEEE